MTPYVLALLLVAGARRGEPLSFDVERYCPTPRSHGLDTAPLAAVPRAPDTDPLGPMLLLMGQGYQWDDHSFVAPGRMEQADRFVELRLSSPEADPEPRPVMLPVPADLEPLAAQLADGPASIQAVGIPASFVGHATLAVHGDVPGHRLVATLHMLWAQRHPELRLLVAAEGAALPVWLDPEEAAARLAGGPLTWPAGCEEVAGMFSMAIEAGPLAGRLLANIQPELERAARRCEPQELAHILTNFQLAVCEHQPAVRWSIQLDPAGQPVEVDPSATWAELAPLWLTYEDRAIWPVLAEQGGEQQGTD